LQSARFDIIFGALSGSKKQRLDFFFEKNFEIQKITSTFAPKEEQELLTN